MTARQQMKAMQGEDYELCFIASTRNTPMRNENWSKLRAQKTTRQQKREQKAKQMKLTKDRKHGFAEKSNMCW